MDGRQGEAQGVVVAIFVDELPDLATSAAVDFESHGNGHQWCMTDGRYEKLDRVDGESSAICDETRVQHQFSPMTL